MNYESFLDNQIIRQRAIWFRDLPIILNDLVQVIHQVGDKIESGYLDDAKRKRFGSSLLKLRTYYKDIKIIQSGEHTHDAESDSRDLIDLMIHEIRRWQRTTNIKVSLRTISNPKFYGQATIAAKYLIESSNGV